ncbi:hypothetical protein [Phaeobacter gallaeciensis]|uniref:5-carboxymethyl-2-hydroxymuconate isomerase n=1 Tax=Phaeobacter gallaeciensis TaxID=60890 RepID=A0AAC9Z6J4_9RHOB|nr:hypothetical protein [Phaeobacter gallaeciensis]AHD08210.1 hypothetical protein Gal_00417 [Phaeobacter gallaeciensis DSM 26640]ATE91476.1 hypothetical protein PhaeoP11_00414 [Phaeobacter gallaeciensis]ATE95752.1 hypothetical protein PhaeoP73_00415 [Phaeobacter gallaeciensis]ATF00092.1 hypothetical protein PhaeoP75_00415 [Phaeobacter gallaeciensis]ATF04524.1 hypothetical protein PhaeoP63_00415 [Phaeobacter gallaeciensis]
MDTPMPHAEIKYSSNLDLDIPAILAEIEQVILSHDDGAGDCKGRGYSTDTYHHTHVAVKVSVLVKPHRDANFSNTLLKSLHAAITARISVPCAFSLELAYTGPFYITGQHHP